jgi:hypothetical protein
MKNDEILKILEYINAIEQNYPTENYTMLREALDYCLEMLRNKVDNEKQQEKVE